MHSHPHRKHKKHTKVTKVIHRTARKPPQESAQSALPMVFGPASAHDQAQVFPH